MSRFNSAFYNTHTIAFILFASVLSISASTTGFALIGPKWSGGNVTLTVNIAGSSPSGTTWDQAMREAANKWGDSTSGLQITFDSQSGHPCAGYVSAFAEDGGKNSTGFYSDSCGEAFGTDVIAVTLSQSTTLSSGQQYVESDIVFNSAETWDVYNGSALFSKLDFRRVATHEFGHLIGVDHEQSIAAIMAPFIGDIENPTTDDLAASKSLYSANTTPSQPAMRSSLEEPAANQVASGITNIRGWAVAQTGVRKVELYLDNNFVATIPYGGSRGDVGNSFPTYSNSSNSGYSMAFNWGNQSKGTHSIEVRSYDNAGNIDSKKGNYTVAAFDTSFIRDPNKVQITGTATVSNNRVITLNQVNADGKTYQVTLEWNTATQKWDITSIN